jgi:hypothetical protein
LATCLAPPIFCLNALAFLLLALVTLMASLLMVSHSGKFRHSLQLQPSQYSSAEKHAQYSLRHLDFLQLHAIFFCRGG